MMTYKRFVRRFIILALLPFLLVMALNFVVDPLQYYRQPSFYSPYYSMQQRYQNPGLARNYEYDTIIIGTSMSENFVPSYVDEQLQVKSLKLAISAGSAREQNLTASVAAATGRVQNIIWELNLDSFVVDADQVQEQFGPFPYYLYSDNVLGGLSYLVNRGTTELSYDILASHLGYKDLPSRELDMLNNWNWQFTYAESEVKKEWETADRAPTAVDANHMRQQILDNIAVNYLAFVSDHPEINFYFFYPPFSILKYRAYYEKNEELFYNFLFLKEHFFAQLGGLENVKIYDFQHEEKITFDLDLYKDLSHYHQGVNEFMIDAISRDEYRVTPENINSTMEKLRQQTYRAYHGDDSHDIF